MFNDNTVVALATPRGKGAIALIRVSGSCSRNMVSKLAKLASGKDICNVKTHTVNYGSMYDVRGNLLDAVLFLIMDAPRSFTGEDIVEITCHNNNYVINSIIDSLCSVGARPALPGEFSRRAVMNDKIDLLKAEGINDLINATNYASVKASLSQIEGSLSSEISNIDSELSKISAWCRASFEFLEDDRDFSKDILGMLKNVDFKVKKILSTGSSQKIVREGIRIAILGSPNVGKSSLFNFLANKNRSIISDEPGTTRDVIEHTVFNGGINKTFIDTAGIRGCVGEIEAEGIARAFWEAESADIIVVLCDAKEILDGSVDNDLYTELIDKNKDNFIFAVNKIDLISDISLIRNSRIIDYARKYSNSDASFISVKENIGMESFIDLIERKFGHMEDVGSLPFLLNNRQSDLIIYISNKLDLIISLFAKKNIMYELIIEEIQDIQEAISDITGRDANEESIDRVFREFCVGK
jgi:tRNA modification GTPase